MKRFLPAVMGLAFLLASCAYTTPIPPTATPSVTASPQATITLTSPPAARTDCASRYPSSPQDRKIWPGEEWSVSTLEEHCMDRAKVERGVWYLERTHNYRSLVVVRHGELVYEKYFADAYRPERRAEMYSMTKSVLSALFGVAMEQGLLDSLDHKVIEYFPEYFYATTNPLMKEMTLRDLMTMSVPVDWTNENDITVAPWINSGNMVEKAINLKLQRILPPGPEFMYCTPNTQILSAILTKIVGEDLRTYAQRNLFSPLGIAAGDWSWGVDDHGYALGGYGMFMRPRDIARFGYLYSSRGYWNGKQLVSKEWVEQSTTSQIRAEPPSIDYGYLWWVHRSSDPAIFDARGSGGQVLSVVPSLDLVVVVNGKDGGDLPDPDFVIHEYIIKAVVDE